MKLKPIALILSSLALSGVVQADENPVTAALKAEGAQVTLPVQAAPQSFSNEFVDSARAQFNNFHWQMGGDHALYYNMHMSEFMPTAVASPSEHYKPLIKELHPELAQLTVHTESKGEMTMQDYLADPKFRTQGFMLIHKGKIVYEAYPGMKPTDRHIWASAAKTTVGTVVAMLAEEGKIDHNKIITEYVPELKGTVWDQVTVLNALNHATGLDNEETEASIMNPDSPVVRFFASAFGSPRFSTGQHESWIDVARDTKKIEGDAPGKQFRYASMNTIVLTQMIENIEGTTWAKVFEDRVWSKVNARQPMLINQTPDGMAIAVGLVSTTLEDMARWGTLFTPSWSAVTDEPIVSQAMLDRIHNNGDKTAFAGTTKEASSLHAFNEKASYNSYQFDYIFEDGAMSKSGNLGQFIYVDPDRDFVGVVFSTNPYHSGFGENKAPALMRSAAKVLAGH
ncbi:serine hydrolase domain-containing protein [Agarivorans sp. QJM3NY_29]|uniref:serine hydrolase domain-containing protein n=1 Tax=unclassified Agarivorans TaxID=2636026 RepID=UPI003D7C9ECE